MTHHGEIPDMQSLLCERCGYLLDDLDRAGECPECGVSIASVLPRLRKGSPWQRSQSLGSLIRTWWLLLTHPRASWENFQIHLASSLTLMACGLVFATSLPSVLVLGIVFYGGIVNEAPEVIGWAIMYLALIGGGFLLVAMLYSAFAVTRIKFWARQRGYRMDSNIAWTIIGNASLGLSLIPLLLIVAILAMILIGLLVQLRGDHSTEFTLVMIILGYSSWILSLAAIPTGLIVFEVLSTMGVRRLRYRNLHSDEKSKPDPPSEPGPPIVVN